MIDAPLAENEVASRAACEQDAPSREILGRRLRWATEDSRVPHQRVVQWLRTWGTPGSDNQAHEVDDVLVERQIDASSFTRAMIPRR